MHLTSSPIVWYLARASGITAYLLLTMSVLVGLLMSSKSRRPPVLRLPRFALEDVHRFIGLLMGSFIVIHFVSIAIDNFLPFTIMQLIVPFTAKYRPLWTALGICAAELMIALAVTNHYRARLPYAFWRRAHYLNFAVWIATTLHGLGSGSDRGAWWTILLYCGCSGLVIATTFWRITSRHPDVPRAVRMRATRIGTATGIVLLVGLASHGPLKAHPAPWNNRHFQEAMTGSILHENGSTMGIVSMDGTGNGIQNVLVRADLLIQAQGSGTRMKSTAFQLEYLPSSDVCSGTVTSVQPRSFDARCALRHRAGHLQVHVEWDPSTTTDVSGTITVKP